MYQHSLSLLIITTLRSLEETGDSSCVSSVDILYSPEFRSCFAPPSHSLIFFSFNVSYYGLNLSATAPPEAELAPVNLPLVDACLRNSRILYHKRNKYDPS
jgi:hypothetical protein